MKPITNSECYVGAPLCLGQRKKSTVEKRLYMVNARVKGWKSKLFNHAYRATLIKSMTSPIPQYHMACFLIPRSIYKSFNAPQRDF